MYSSLCNRRVGFYIDDEKQLNKFDLAWHWLTNDRKQDISPAFSFSVVGDPLGSTAHSTGSLNRRKYNLGVRKHFNLLGFSLDFLITYRAINYAVVRAL